MDGKIISHQRGMLTRIILFSIVWVAGAASASAILTLQINTGSKTVKFVGTGPYTDLVADETYTYKVRFRTNTTTTGSYVDIGAAKGMVDVGGLDNTILGSFIQMKSTGMVMDVQFSFSSLGGITEGYLTGSNISYSYAESNLFTTYLGDGSNINGTTLVPFMPNPELTFPDDPSPSISIQVVPEPRTWAFVVAIVGLAWLMKRRR